VAWCQVSDETPKQSSSQCLRDKASSALERATGKPGADLPAFAPNHFVGGLFARQAQDKLVGHFKIMQGADAYTAVGSVDHETKLLWRARLGHDDREVPELATQRATSIRKCGPDHMSPTILAKHRRSLLAQMINSRGAHSNSRCILEKSAVADAFRLILTVCEGRCSRKFPEHQFRRGQSPSYPQANTGLQDELLALCFA
jgi:hypothetical protein